MYLLRVKYSISAACENRSYLVELLSSLQFESSAASYMFLIHCRSARLDIRNQLQNEIS